MLISFPLGQFPGVEWLDYIIDLFTDYWGISILPSTIIILDYIPTNSALGYQGTLFSTSSPALVLFDNNHCNHSESLPPGSCGFYSVMVNEVELLFLYFSAICISSSEKCLSVPFAPFLTRGCLASCCWVFEVAWILVHGQADSLHILSSILPGVCVVAHFLSCAEASLMQSHLFLLPMPVGSCPSHLIMGKAAQNALDRGQPVSSINGAGKTRHL